MFKKYLNKTRTTTLFGHSLFSLKCLCFRSSKPNTCQSNYTYRLYDGWWTKLVGSRERNCVRAKEWPGFSPALLRDGTLCVFMGRAESGLDRGFRPTKMRCAKRFLWYNSVLLLLRRWLESEKNIQKNTHNHRLLSSSTSVNEINI